jgi:hypothetical protein
MSLPAAAAVPMVNCSWAYWSQQHQQSAEIIIGGDVRVLRKIR